MLGTHDIHDHLNDLLAGHVREGATILVATEGDDPAALRGRRALAFPERLPRTYPASGLAAIAELEAQRALGADFLLVLPDEAGRLDEDPVFDRHLRQRYRAILDDDRVAILFDLRARRTRT